MLFLEDLGGVSLSKPTLHVKNNTSFWLIDYIIFYLLAVSVILYLFTVFSARIYNES